MTPSRHSLIAGTVLALCSTAAGSAPIIIPVGTAFTYQGRLDDLGQPAEGLYDFRFALWTAAEFGISVGSIAVHDVPVEDGLFTVDLDFGDVDYTGGALWLAISAGPDGEDLVDLEPRQRIRPTPVALGAMGVAAGAVGADEVDASEVQLRVEGSCGPEAAIASIAEDGSVVCEADDVGTPPVFHSTLDPYTGPAVIWTGANFTGIHTQSPEAALHVQDVGSTHPALLIAGASSSEGDLAWPSTQALNVGTWNLFSNQFTERLRIGPGGTVWLDEVLTFDDTTGDKISLFDDRIGLSSMYGFGVASGTLTYKSNGAHSWFVKEADAATAAPSMHLEKGGLGIGTTNVPAAYRLAVNGAVRAKEIVVEVGWADDVFEEGYVLASLEEVAAHIAAHGHLPGVPSAAEIEAGGVPVGEMTSTLLRKVEELTLYVLDLERRLATLSGPDGGSWR